MEALILSLLVWIGMNTDFNLPKDKSELPKVEHKTAKELKVMAFGEKIDVGLKPVEAVYDRELKTMYLKKGFDASDKLQQMFLVHELVHFLQAFNKKEFGCKELEEREAIKIANAWYRAQGLRNNAYEYLEIFVAMPCLQ